jgi:hypothetical protein
VIPVGETPATKPPAVLDAAWNKAREQWKESVVPAVHSGWEKTKPHWLKLSKRMRVAVIAAGGFLAMSFCCCGVGLIGGTGNHSTGGSGNGGSGASSQSGGKENREPAVPSGARPLETRVGAFSFGGHRPTSIIVDLTSYLKNVKCYATADHLLIHFDADVAAWQRTEFARPVPLLVRILDRNGNLLTHLTTREAFTASRDGYGVFLARYNGASQHGAGNRVPKPVLLDSNRTELAYSVNVRDIRDAAIVEVGFTMGD